MDAHVMLLIYLRDQRPHHTKSNIYIASFELSSAQFYNVQ